MSTTHTNVSSPHMMPEDGSTTSTATTRSPRSRGLLVLGLTALLGFAGFGVGCKSDAQAGTGLGALIGAGAGYIIGNETGAGEGEGALIGAAVGGAVGYGVGNEQDKKKMRSNSGSNYNW